MRASERGFTLIEVLVGIAILGILAGILLPVFASAREQGRKASCAFHLKQIGVAFQMYAQDYDETCPNTGHPYLWMGRYWRWPLMPYLALGQLHGGNPLQATAGRPGILLCPSDPDAPQKWDSTSYGYSAAFYHTPAQINAMTTDDLWKWPPENYPYPPVSQPLAAIAYPAQKAAFAEWLTNHTSPQVGWWDWRGGRNYLFADGHVRFLPARALRPAVNRYPDINLTRDGLAGRDVD